MFGSQLKRHATFIGAVAPQGAGTGRSLTEIELADVEWMDARCSASARCSTGEILPSGHRVRSSDEEWTDDVLWRNLIEGQATVLVGEDAELLLVPLRRGVIDRLTGRVSVSVAPRTHGHASSYATLSRLGRHPVRQMRALAHA